MYNSLINNKVQDVLNNLIGELFKGNRLLDRQMSILSTKFAMKKTSDVLHPALAHAYPILADFLSDYMDSRNSLVVYPMTPEDKADYSNPLEIFNKYLQYQLNLEKMIDDAIYTVENEADRNTKVFLEQFLLKIQAYTNQALILVDATTNYGSEVKDWMQLNRDIEDFIIVDQLSSKSFVKEG